MPFPNELTNALDGDIIYAFHLNNLEEKVGITGSADTNSLDYQLTNSASVDPGHKHSISAVNGLQAALDAKVTGNASITGATKTKITYDSNGLVTAGADATTTDIAEGTRLYFTEARVLATPLTGLSITGSAIVSTDTILEAIGKTQNQINALVGGVNYQGTWNATTNSPTIVSGTGTKGYYYVVSVAGSTDIDGITDWKLGDWIIFNGTTWQKVDNTDAVISVNGYLGIVTLTTADVAEVTNLYFTNARAVTAMAGLYEVPLTFSTGLTRATNTITANLSTGISGGQSAIGGTASGENLTLSSTAHAIKGKILLGTSAYDEVNNRLGVGTTSPATTIHSLSTTEQLRLSYDASNRLSTTVASNGSTTVLATGTTPIYTLMTATQFKTAPTTGLDGFFTVTGTLPNTASPQSQWMTFYSEGTMPVSPHSSSNYLGTRFRLVTGGTASPNVLAAGYFDNTAVSNATVLKFRLNSLGTANGSYGHYGSASGASTTGINYGTYGNAGNSAFANIGVAGRAVNTGVATSNNVGVFGHGLNTAGGTSIGGWFTLADTDPVFVSSALVADNGTTGVPIFLARDNATTVFQIIDGGFTGINVSPTSRLHVADTIGVGAFGTRFDITTSGTTNSFVIGHRVNLLAGYTGANQADAFSFNNLVAGTGNGNHFNANYNGNHGAYGATAGVTTGTNVGLMAYARDGNLNIGSMGTADSTKANARNVGVGGMAVATSGSGTWNGGVFVLNSALSSLTLETAALLCDNMANADPIFLARDNGTRVFSIIDGGNVIIGNVTPTAKLQVAGGIFTGTGVAATLGFAQANGEIGIFNLAGDSRLDMGQLNTHYGSIIWRYNATPANAYLDISTARKMRIDGHLDILMQTASTGNVGIGTLTPGRKLSVYYNPGSAIAAGMSFGHSGAGGSLLGILGTSTGHPLGGNRIVFNDDATNTFLQTFDFGNKRTGFGNASLTPWDGTSPLGLLHAFSSITTEIVSIFQGATSQTADLTQWRKQDNTVYGKVDATGNLFMPTIKATSVSGYLSSDGSAGATGSFTTTDLKTVTVKDGIITSIA